MTDGARAAGGYVYGAGAAGIGFVGSKLEETGVTDTAKAAGGFVYSQGAAGLGYVNNTIE